MHAQVSGKQVAKQRIRIYVLIQLNVEYLFLVPAIVVCAMYPCAVREHR